MTRVTRSGPRRHRTPSADCHKARLVSIMRVAFTMDDHYYKAVIKVFAELYNNGLIYRGARMINWDPKAKTALSDEEVEYRDIQGTLYYVKYKKPNPYIHTFMKTHIYFRFN